MGKLPFREDNHLLLWIISQMLETFDKLLMNPDQKPTAVEGLGGVQLHYHYSIIKYKYSGAP